MKSTETTCSMNPRKYSWQTEPGTSFNPETGMLDQNLIIIRVSDGQCIKKFLNVRKDPNDKDLRATLQKKFSEFMSSYKEKAQL